MRLLSALIVLLTLGCQQGTKQENNQPAPNPTNAVQSRTIHFVSEDGAEHFHLTVSGTDTVLLKLDNQPQPLQMVRVVAASGEKYQTADSLYFWSKGSTFIYGRSDSIYTSGAIASE